jgi:ribonuclease HI
VASSLVLVHLDESCLGNGRAGDSPGGAGGLVEVWSGGAVHRRDLYLSAPSTTNNRMALGGAIAALEALSAKGRRHTIRIVSDSEYLIKGITQWAPGWVARGWRRKAGPIENLPLWQELWRRAGAHDVDWRWVRGHAGHPKNEYVNDLAIKAAKEQVNSEGLTASGFLEWLEKKRARGAFAGYDPDEGLPQGHGMP